MKMAIMIWQGKNKKNDLGTRATDRTEKKMEKKSGNYYEYLN